MASPTQHTQIYPIQSCLNQRHCAAMRETVRLILIVCNTEIQYRSDGYVYHYKSCGERNSTHIANVSRATIWCNFWHYKDHAMNLMDKCDLWDYILIYSGVSGRAINQSDIKGTWLSFNAGRCAP
eukprot:363741_1